MANPSLAYQQMLADQSLWTYTLNRLEQVGRGYTMADLRRDVQSQWAAHAAGSAMDANQARAYITRAQAALAAGAYFNQTKQLPSPSSVYPQPFLQGVNPWKVRAFIEWEDTVSGQSHGERAEWAYPTRPTPQEIQSDLRAYCLARARYLTSQEQVTPAGALGADQPKWRCVRVTVRTLESADWTR